MYINYGTPVYINDLPYLSRQSTSSRAQPPDYAITSSRAVPAAKQAGRLRAPRRPLLRPWVTVE